MPCDGHDFVDRQITYTNMNMMLVSNKENVIISGDRNDSLATSRERLVVRGSPKAVYPTSVRSSRLDFRREFRMEVFPFELELRSMDALTCSS